MKIKKQQLQSDIEQLTRSKFFKLAFSSMWIENFQMYKLGFKDSKESEIKLPIFTGS